ncbi:MAG TPA: gas vesicle protein [Acidimicrobiales bacterium]|nr:gas vesicle protein [Acidimicrobiales bacterium]
MATPSPYRRSGIAPPPQGANLADVLERVLDKGLVVAGDIRINLLDIELLTIKIRLLVASADKAAEMGITWWRDDPFLQGREQEDGDRDLEARLARLEARLGELPESSDSGAPATRKARSKGKGR